MNQVPEPRILDSSLEGDVQIPYGVIRGLRDHCYHCSSLISEGKSSLVFLELWIPGELFHTP